MKQEIIAKSDFDNLEMFKKLPKLKESFYTADYGITFDMYLFDWYQYSLELLRFLKTNPNFSFLSQQDFDDFKFHKGKLQAITVKNKGKSE